MEQTVSTVWYVKKCALGALVCCVSELVLLAATAALMLNGTVGEERIDAAALVAASLAAFAGCCVGSGRTSKRMMMTFACVASSWLVVQVIGFLAGGELEPTRSLMTAAAMLAGAAASLLLHGKGKKRKKRSASKARRGRR